MSKGGIEIPSDYKITLDFVDQPIQTDVEINGTMTTNFNGDIKSDSHMSLAPITINPIEIDMGLDDIRMQSKIDMGLDNIKADLCLSVGIREFPKMRVHFPINYEFGLELLGIKIFNFSICGKSMVVTEDNPVKMFYAPQSATYHDTDDKASFKVSVGD